MSDAGSNKAVRCYEQQVVIPTYPVQDADPNPMFLEKRVYQGSSGKVYPNPFTDRVALQKEDRSYRAIFLENEFIQLMILPEIGGRIHAAARQNQSVRFLLSPACHQAGAGGPAGPVDLWRRGVQLAAASPSLDVHACPCRD